MNRAALELIIQLKDEATAALGRVQGAVQSLGATAAGAAAAGLVALGAAVGAFGASAVDVAANFDTQMARVGAVAGATAEEMQALRTAAIEMGSSTVFSASEAGAALFELTAGGMNATQAIDALPGTLALAAAGGVELASAAEISAATLNGFGLAASDAGAVADKFATIANISAAGVLDLGESMKYLAPVAASLGVSIDDAGAALAVLANNGIKGSEAGTALRAIMLGLAAPSTAAAKELQNLGIQVFDAEGKMKSIPDVIAAFNAGMAGLTEQQRAAAIATIVGREASGAMLAMMAAGEETLAGFSTRLAESGGAAGTMATQMQTAFDLMKGNVGGAIEQLQIAIGGLLIPVLTDLGNQFAGLVERALAFVPTIQAILGALTDAGPMSLEFAEALGMIHPGLQQAALFIGPLITALQGGLLPALVGVGGVLAAVVVSGLVSAAAAAAAAAAPFVALAAVGAALYVAWQTNFAGVQTVTTSVLGTVQSFVQGALGAILGFWQQNGAAILADASAIWAQVQAVITVALQLISQLVTNVANTLRAIWQQNGADIANTLRAAWDLVVAIVRTALTLLGGIIQTALAVLRGDWSGAWTAITTTTQSVLSGLGQIVAAGMRLIEGGLRAAIGSIVTIANGLGANISSGIAEGIKNGVSGIINAARDAARRALDAAKSALNIKSPSRVFEEQVGAQIPAGMVRGILAGIGDAERAARTLATATIPAALGALPAAGGAPIAAPVAGTTTNTTNITVNASYAYQDERSLRDDLRGVALMMS